MSDTFHPQSNTGLKASLALTQLLFYEVQI